MKGSAVVSALVLVVGVAACSSGPAVAGDVIAAEGVEGLPDGLTPFELGDGTLVVIDDDEPLPEAVVDEIAGAAPYGAYEPGDVLDAADEAPSTLRQEVGYPVAEQTEREVVWVTDAVVLAQGGVVEDVHIAVDGTGEAGERLREEWRYFGTPEEALAYAEDVVASVSEPDRYDVIPYGG